MDSGSSERISRGGSSPLVRTIYFQRLREPRGSLFTPKKRRLAIIWPLFRFCRQTCSGLGNCCASFSGSIWVGNFGRMAKFISERHQHAYLQDVFDATGMLDVVKPPVGEIWAEADASNP